MIPRRKYYTERNDLALLARYAFNRRSGLFVDAARDLEDAFREQFAFSGVNAFALGRSAMSALIDALELPPGAEVILPALGFKGTAGLIKRAGLKPVFADIERDGVAPGIHEVEQKISPDSKAFIPVHLFGYPCELSALSELCKENGIVVIEDCAHGPGIISNNAPAGHIGDAAFFSFNLLKPVNAYMGGLAATDNKELSEKIRRKSETMPEIKTAAAYSAVFKAWLQNLLFLSPAYTPIAWAFGFKTTGRFLEFLNDKLLSEKTLVDTALHPLLAKIALERLDTLEDRIPNRLATARVFDDAMGVTNELHFPASPNRASGYFYLVRSQIEAGDIRRRLLGKGIDAGIKSEVVDFMPEDKDLYPNAFELWDSILQIPLYENMEQNEAAAIADELLRLRKSGDIAPLLQSNSGK